MNIRPLESLTKEELIELIRLERRGEPVAKEIERRVYHNTSEYKSYLSARFDRSRSNSRVSFEWGGHRWAYRYTHFDDCGEYDLIVRPLPAPQPDHIPDAGKMVVSDRSMKEIKAALAGAKGKEHTLIFSAKEVRSLLNTIVNQNQRIERFEKKIADHIVQDRKMPTDTKMLDWLIENEALICYSVTNNLYEVWFGIDNVETGKTAREAIINAMRGEE